MRSTSGLMIYSGNVPHGRDITNTYIIYTYYNKHVIHYIFRVHVYGLYFQRSSIITRLVLIYVGPGFLSGGGGGEHLPPLGSLSPPLGTGRFAC